MEQLKNCVDFFNKLILKELSVCTNTWIAGGAVRDYFSGTEFSDIDLFFKTEKGLTRLHRLFHKAYFLLQYKEH
jgi:tRNA nucleotidyltransferase/poly(A) polymerase